LVAIQINKNAQLKTLNIVFVKRSGCQYQIQMYHFVNQQYALLEIDTSLRLVA
jgi:hypothetical protein